MGFRFRIGPFTFGKGGTRLSIWKGSAGVSVPLSKKGRTFGKVGIGPVNYHFGSSSRKTTEAQNISEPKEIAIEAFASDQKFLNKIEKYGVPWRGVQERIKEELPENLSGRNDIAYMLVPIAMNAVFGEQNTAWKTERRPSKSGKGCTTWVVIIEGNA